MTEDAESQARMIIEMQEATKHLQSLQSAIQQSRFTAQELAEGMYQIAPVLAKVWEQTVGNDTLWQARIDGPVYRQTSILGHFRWYRQFRVWQLRRSLSR